MRIVFKTLKIAVLKFTILIIFSFQEFAFFFLTCVLTDCGIMIYGGRVKDHCEYELVYRIFRFAAWGNNRKANARRYKIRAMCVPHDRTSDFVLVAGRVA